MHTNGHRIQHFLNMRATSLLAPFILTLAPFITASPTDPSVIFARAACSTPYGSGTCVDTSSCTTGGFNIAGYCPGPANIQCCISKTCTTSSGSGNCMNTADTCSGAFVAGACPGPSTVQCCTKEKCSTSSGAGVCQVTSTACGGKYIAGACPGPTNVQVCISHRFSEIPF